MQKYINTCAIMYKYEVMRPLRINDRGRYTWYDKA